MTESLRDPYPTEGEWKPFGESHLAIDTAWVTLLCRPAPTDLNDFEKERLVEKLGLLRDEIGALLDKLGQEATK